MSRSYISHKSSRSDELTKPDASLPTPHNVSDVSSYATTAKSRPLRGLIVSFAVLSSICITLYLLLHDHSYSTHDLHPRFSRSKTIPDPSHDASPDQLESNLTSTIAPRDVDLSPRQGKGTRYSFWIPLASPRFRFLSRGSIDRSTIKVMPYTSPRKFVLVKILVRKDPQKVAKAFTFPVPRGGPVQGVGFSAPDQATSVRAKWPSFSVVVQIPVTPEQRLRLGSFETNLPQFDHEFADLSKLFVFSRIIAQSNFAQMKFGEIAASTMQISNTNGPLTFGAVSTRNIKVTNTNGKMTFGSMTAASISLANRNGQISGTMTALKELVMANQNSKITGDFTLLQRGTAKFTTRNAPITGQLRLKASDTLTVPDFRIQASTLNQPVDLKVLEQPIASAFHLQAYSNVGVRVRLAAAFEGAFRIKTTQNRPVVQMTGKEDPTGRKRERLMMFDKPNSKASGKIAWGRGREKRALGSVSISTVKGPAQLFFD